MESPTRSFQSFIRSNAPIPQTNPQKPLPCVPARSRRSSSVYSARSERSAERPHSNKAPESESPYLLEPKTYSPGILRHYESSSPISTALSSSSSDEGYLPLLPRKQYTLRTPSTTREQKEQVEQTQLSSSAPPLRAEASKNDLQTAYPRDFYLHSLDDLAPSPGDIVFFAEEDDSEIPHLPVQQTEGKDKASHQRIMSQEKGLIAMGIDSHNLKDEADQRARRHMLFSRTQPRTSARQRNQAQASEEAPPHRRPSLLASSRGSSTSVASSSSSSLDSQVFARDYHALLTDQYQHEKLTGDSDVDVKAAMRMVPAPLFFQKSAANHKRSISSGKDTKSYPKSSSVRSTPRQAESSARVLSLFGGGENARASGSGSRSKATESTHDPTTRPTQQSPKRLFMGSRLAELVQRPSVASPVGHHEGNATNPDRYASSTLPVFSSPQRSARVSRKEASASPSGHFGAFLTSAVDRAKEGLASLSSISRGDEDGVTAWSKMEQSLGRGRSNSQKRREELKGSIRIVGDVDPAAAAVAERLKGVELGRFGAVV